MIRCEAQNINYGEQCSRPATYRMTGGVQAGLHFCSQHVNRRSRYAQPIDGITRFVGTAKPKENR